MKNSPKKKNKLKKRNKLLLIAFIILVLFSATVPLLQVAMRVYYKTPIYIYYHQDKTSSFCQVLRIIDTSTSNASRNQLLQDIVSSALLMPHEKQLENNNNKNVFLQNAVIENKTAIVSLSGEYYDLTAKERSNTLMALLLAIAANLPEIERIEWLVDQEEALEINDQNKGSIPKIIDSYISLPLSSSKSDKTLRENAIVLQDNIIKTQKALLPRDRMSILVGRWPDDTPITLRDCRLR